MAFRDVRRHRGARGADQVQQRVMAADILLQREVDPTADQLRPGDPPPPSERPKATILRFREMELYPHHATCLRHIKQDIQDIFRESGLTRREGAPKGVQVPSPSERRCDLCVAGFVYFEVHAPVEGGLPASGQERFVPRLPVVLGGAINTASVGRRLGLDVTLVHPSGEVGLTDVAIRHALAQADLPAVRFPSRADPALTLVFSDARDRGMLSAADAEALAACPTLPPARWIHVPGLREARLLAPRLAEARAAGARVSVSGSFAPDELARLGDEAAEAGPRWDLLVFNEREAQVLTGSAEAALERLAGAARDLVVTLGDRGAIGILAGEAVRTDAAALDVAASSADPTGAGDAFCAGLLAALVRDWPGPRAIRFAAKVAAKVLGVRGGAVLEPGLLDPLLAELERPPNPGGEP